MRKLSLGATLLAFAACTGEVIAPPPLPPVETGTGGGAPTEQTCTPGPTGVSPMVRLSREQVDHAATDLLQAAFVPSSALTADEKVGPFAANTSVQMTRSLAEQYQFVAEKLGAELEPRALAVAPCADQTNGASACAKAFVTRFGALAFRRPLEADEVTAYVGLFDKVKAASTYALGIRSMVEALLQSPSFLYRVELPPTPETTEAWAVDQYALATRLAYLLWNSAPDQALLDAAGRGALGTDEGLSTQLERMLADPRRQRAVTGFATAWAELEPLSTAATSPERLAGLDPALVPQMEDETVRFLSAALDDERPPMEALFTAQWTVASPALAKALYGVTAAPDAKGRLTLAGTDRAGVLTQAGVLFSHSHAQQTSPVLRGKWVRKVLFCQEVPDPPANVNATPPDPVPGQTTRERFSAHRTDPSCSGCHRLMDDIGFSLEGFDQHGVARTMEGTAPVDVRGSLIGTDVDGAYLGAAGLGTKLAASSSARLCFAKQWFRSGLSRPEAASETCLVKAMSKALENPKGYRALLDTLVHSQAFKERKAP
ncbi:MAG: DUF1588 domain-containing protein [Myxococcaceae bacterium]|nr:DUF1588 domain-containing protein [Myxococcaceae bacterium]